MVSASSQLNSVGSENTAGSFFTLSSLVGSLGTPRQKINNAVSVAAAYIQGGAQTASDKVFGPLESLLGREISQGEREEIVKCAAAGIGFSAALFYFSLPAAGGSVAAYQQFSADIPILNIDVEDIASDFDKQKAILQITQEISSAFSGSSCDFNKLFDALVAVKEILSSFSVEDAEKILEVAISRFESSAYIEPFVEIIKAMLASLDTIVNLPEYIPSFPRSS